MFRRLVSSLSAGSRFAFVTIAASCLLSFVGVGSASAAWVTYQITLTPDDSTAPGPFVGTFEVDHSQIPLGICGGCNHTGLRNFLLVYDGVDLSTNFLPLVTLSLDDTVLGARYLTGVSGSFPFVFPRPTNNLSLLFGNVDGNVIDPLDPPTLTYYWGCMTFSPGGGCTSGDYVSGTYQLVGPPMAAAPEPATLALAALGLTALGITRRRRQQLAA